ncbi:hypothetical protein DFR52_107142 [Hoeflea marina]|uniref:Outer membrane lipoprotein omp10 n=1 Tax=Hoeflea marina TaxID=274592 RepID=A0A317PE83_9HYPH|nr:outer membrane lipoprotein Omp10 [Hoeflea marina]PWV97228.1 hypothetical protein DFR52_107142 [Hoeflea marina]
MNTTRIVAIATLALTLAACQTETYSYREPAPRQDTIEGQWVDPNGIISSFYNGRFETRTTDSNSLLAEGNYRQISPRTVEIELTSLLRNTTSRVNCAMVTPSQLNCTSSTGAQFSLARRA